MNNFHSNGSAVVYKVTNCGTAKLQIVLFVITTTHPNRWRASTSSKEESLYNAGADAICYSEVTIGGRRGGCGRFSITA
jgi:hypothetical protein